MIFLDVIVVLLILILAQLFIVFFSKGKSQKIKNDLKNLWYYHLLFGFAFMFYTSNFGGDALKYWSKYGYHLGNTIQDYLRGGEGTAFIHLLNYPFVHIMELSYFTGTVIYSFVGFLGLLFFYLSANDLIKADVRIYGINLFPEVFFLPNLHFWSAGVGKDTLSFFCIGLLLYSSMRPKVRFTGILLSLYLLYNIRPHMAVFLLVAFGLGALIDGKLKKSYKVVLSLCFVVAAVLLFDNVMNYIKLDEVSAQSIEQYSDKRVTLLSQGNTGSSVDVTSYPLPLKVFTFLYRPLFFDAHNVTSLLASLENVMLLLLTYLLIKSKPYASFKLAPYQIKALMLFIIIGSIAFSSTMGNTGIMMRMKNMFTPALLIFILHTLSNRRSVKKLNDNLKGTRLKGGKIKLV